MCVVDMLIMAAPTNTKMTAARLYSPLCRFKHFQQPGPGMPTLLLDQLNPHFLSCQSQWYKNCPAVRQSPDRIPTVSHASQLNFNTLHNLAHPFKISIGSGFKNKPS